MKLISLLLACVSMASAHELEESEVPETIWLQNADILSCSPSKLRTSGKLTLLLGPGHGKEPIFTFKGLYTIHTSEVLESEMGGYKCSVSFMP